MEKKGLTINIQPQLHQIREPEPPTGPVLFAYGFRPFFILALGWGAWSMALWLMILYGPLESPGSLPSSWWHGHEMIFGFVGAAAAGFLLTAVTNWTQSKPLTGIPLMALAGIWLLGRVLMWFAPEGALWIVACVDLSFLFALIVAVTLPVIRTRKYHQGVFPALLGLLWVANLLFHLEWMGITQETSITGMRLGINGILWLIVVFGGRMLPSFTQNALSSLGTGARVRTWPVIEHAATWSMAVVCIVDIFFQDLWATGIVFVVTAIIHAIRLVGWQPHKTLRQPIIWVLHLGYAWLAAGFVFRAVAVLTDWIMPATALHALTVGGFGVTILGIVTRVSLAHTGRPLNPDRTMAAMFLLMTVTALLRLDLAPIDYGWAVSFAGIAWVFCFLIFFLKFLPMLSQPRIDGRPG
ncbi:MAG: NnrS family protein [Magnetococcales bacterium]|nr:NnrS family protein [Magnetococcales bacterium]MBF0174098.1 NnrS family protein [Magnetococcales bacterium]